MVSTRYKRKPRAAAPPIKDYQWTCIRCGCCYTKPDGSDQPDYFCTRRGQDCVILVGDSITTETVLAFDHSEARGESRALILREASNESATS